MLKVDPLVSASFLHLEDIVVFVLFISCTWNLRVIKACNLALTANI